jgi:TIR domain-containing protein
MDRKKSALRHARKKAEESMKHVFVSYAREDRGDKDFARELARRLRALDRIPWQDFRNLRGGDYWQAAIDDALRNAEALVVVLSPYSTASRFVTYEWAFALGAGIRVIPVVRKNSKKTEPHPRLLTIQHIDFNSHRTPWVDLRKALPARPSPTEDTSEIRAEFNIIGGKPEMQRGYYVIRVYIYEPPRSAEQVTYEWHDETLSKRRWRTRAKSKSFESSILSNGDILLTATIRTPGKKELIVSSLSEALQRSYGKRPSKAIHRALRRIEDYRLSGSRA